MIYLQNQDTQLGIIKNTNIIYYSSNQYFLLLLFSNNRTILSASSKKMSIYWQQSRVHALNNSSSKPHYAFAKQTRFNTTSKPLCDSFYDVTRDLKNAKKGTSLGRGNKTTFGDKYGFPSPLHYQVKSTFDQDTKNGKGVKLSLGRQNIKYGGIFRNSETPDPAHYNPRDPRLQSPKSGYTIRTRVKQQEMSYQKNPGPGQYNSISTISATGIYKLSTVSNCICPKIKPSRTYNPSLKQKTPGPGQYNNGRENMNQTGKYFLSKYSDSRCRSFSKSSQRDGLVSKVVVPGPGSYNYYSEFGTKKSKIL